MRRLPASRGWPAALRRAGFRSEAKAKATTPEIPFDSVSFVKMPADRSSTWARASALPRTRRATSS